MVIKDRIIFTGIQSQINGHWFGRNQQAGRQSQRYKIRADIGRYEYMCTRIHTEYHNSKHTRTCAESNFATNWPTARHSCSSPYTDTHQKPKVRTHIDVQTYAKVHNYIYTQTTYIYPRMNTSNIQRKKKKNDDIHHACTCTNRRIIVTE